MIWFPTVQWKLYKSTHSGLNNLVGTWNIHHRANHDLKTYYATLTLILHRGFWSLHYLVHGGHEGSLVLISSSILCVMKHYHSSVRLETYTFRI